MRNERKHIVALAICSVLLFFVGSGGLPVTDPVESNYAETAREMALAGEYVSPIIYGNYWYDKPILFYLELIAAYKIFGFTDFAARFFPAVCSTIGLFLTYGVGRRLYGREVGFTAALLLATALSYWAVGHVIITDMTLFVTMSLTLVLFYFGWREERSCYYYGAFFASAVSVLTKGPIGFFLPGLIILLFLLVRRSLRTLWSVHILLGFLLFVAVAGVWYYPMIEMHGDAFTQTFLGVHNGVRATVSEHPKDDVWYYYTAIFFLGFFPWSLLILPRIWQWVKQRSLCVPTLPETQFLLLWAMTVFVVFQLFATKYVTYTMPYMMPLSILMARYFCHRRKLVRNTVIGMTLFYLVAVLVIAPPIMRGRSGITIAPQLQAAIAARDHAPLVVTYKARYSASMVYYTGVMMYALETRDAIASKKPDGKSWSVKNVMPFYAVEDLRADQDILVVTDPEDAEAAKIELPGTWQEVARTKKWVLLGR